MKLLVKTLKGEKFNVECEPTQTVLEVKGIIVRTTSSSSSSIVLIVRRVVGLSFASCSCCSMTHHDYLTIVLMVVVFLEGFCRTYFTRRHTKMVNRKIMHSILLLLLFSVQFNILSFAAGVMRSTLSLLLVGWLVVTNFLSSSSPCHTLHNCEQQTTPKPVVLKPNQTFVGIQQIGITCCYNETHSVG